MNEGQKRTITKIERQKKDHTRVSIFINDTFAFGIFDDLIVEFNLHKGMIVDDALEAELMKADQKRKAVHKATSLLSYKSRSASEMKKKLIEKEFDEEAAQYAVDKLLEYGYLDDLQYAKDYLSARSQRYGRKRILMELRQRGVSQDVLASLEDEEMDTEDEYKVAYDLAYRKLIQSEGLSGQKVYSRISGMLQRKGFSYGLVKQVLGDLGINPYDR